MQKDITKTTKMGYLDLKKQHEDEFNNFENIFFAFNADQFEEGKKKIGAASNADLIQVFGCGFILRENKDAFSNMLKRHHEEMKQALADKAFLLDALTYELCNHEYCYSWEASEALKALSLKESDIPQDILKQAKQAAMQCC